MKGDNDHKIRQETGGPANNSCQPFKCSPVHLSVSIQSIRHCPTPFTSIWYCSTCSSYYAIAVAASASYQSWDCFFSPIGCPHSTKIDVQFLEEVLWY
ncbi:hypothetical protein J6590_074793 [Homalodisca vitripennis]|nr:hypothetical protein J6590_074793 [Homalodisca vitripennis]